MDRNKREGISLIVGSLTALAVALAIVFGMLWLFWHLWLFVVPAIYSTGPENFIRPGYWLFCAGIVLVVIVVRLIRGGR